MSATNDAQIARINVEKAKAEADAILAHAQAAAEITRMSGAASADAYASQATAEANEMHAKGYTYQEETARQIGLEAMQNGLPGTGASSASAGAVGSAVGDMIGLGITLGTVGSVAGIAKETMAPIVQDVSQIGKSMTGSSSNAVTWNCSCGKIGISSKFCPECGSAMPVNNASWNCSCGCMNITSKFCPNCGQKNPAITEVWECKNCGTKEIKSKFCPNCGQAKEV
jgi:hypothetical protein